MTTLTLVPNLNHSWTTASGEIRRAVSQQLENRVAVLRVGLVINKHDKENSEVLVTFKMKNSGEAVEV